MGNLEFGVTVEELKEADRKIYGVESDEDKDEDEDAGEKEKPIRRPYSIAEDKKVGLLSRHKSFLEIFEVLFLVQNYSWSDKYTTSYDMFFI